MKKEVFRAAVYATLTLIGLATMFAVLVGIGTYVPGGLGIVIFIVCCWLLLYGVFYDT